MKQFILEKTHEREKAQKTSIIQFTNKDSFDLGVKNKKTEGMYIDIQSLFWGKDRLCSFLACSIDLQVSAVESSAMCSLLARAILLI